LVEKFWNQFCFAKIVMNWFVCVIPLFQEHSMEAFLSGPAGALFQVGSGLEGDMNEKRPELFSDRVL